MFYAYVILYFYLFIFAVKQKLIHFFEAETIVKKLRSRMVKCPMSHGYWIIELGFKLRLSYFNIHIYNHFAMFISK